MQANDRAKLRKLVTAVFDAEAKVVGLGSQRPDAWIEKVTDQLVADAWIEKVTDQLVADTEGAYRLLASFGKL